MQLRPLALGLLVQLGLPGSTLAASYDLQTFNVTDYGAKADGSADAQGAISRAIATAAAWTASSDSHQAVVQFSPGTFSLEKVRGIYAIIIDHAKNITITGTPCKDWVSADCTRLIGAAATTNSHGAPLYNTFFHITNAQNIKIENFFLDKKVPYFVQGRIEGPGRASHSIVVRTDPGFMDFSDPLVKTRLNILMAFTGPNDQYWDHSEAGCSTPASIRIAPNSCQLFHIVSTSDEGNGRWQLTLDRDIPNSFSDKRFLVWKNVGWQAGMLVSQVTNFVASRIFYTGGGGPAVHVQQSNGPILIQNFIIDVPAGSDRLFAATSGFNGSSNRGKIILDHTIVRHTDDDAFHFSAGSYFPVVYQSQSHTAFRVDLCYPGDFRPGDELQAWDWANKRSVGSAHVVSIAMVADQEPQKYRRTCDITVSQPLPALHNLRTYSEKNLGIQEDRNDRIVNLSLHPTLTVTNSYLSSMRARCGIIQTSATITHNVCANTPAAGFLVGPEYAWGEGYAVDGAYIAYNQFDNVGGTAIYIADIANSVNSPSRKEMLLQQPTTDQPLDNKNIIIQNNVFRNLGAVSFGIMGIKGAAVTIANANNVSVSGNTFSDTHATAALPASMIVISPFSTQNIKQ